MIFYTSDHHFGHENIIKYTKRYSYCQTAQEMNEILVDKWNSVISKEDTVFHLGDVYFKEGWKVLHRLNGIKFLILGNHDQKNISQLKDFFTILPRDIEVVHSDKIVLAHYPIKDWPHKFYDYIHLHGHSHGTACGYDEAAIDVGVDCWDGYPITLTQIKESMVE